MMEDAPQFYMTLPIPAGSMNDAHDRQSIRMSVVHNSKRSQPRMQVVMANNLGYSL